MSVNSQFTVAVHILTLLAMQDEPLSSKWIAGSVNTNPVVVRRVIGQLNSAGLVETRMGAEGGTLLRRPPEQIRLLDVYHATQEGPVLPLHPNPPNQLCPCGSKIQDPLRTVYARAEDAMQSELAGVTIADIQADIAAQLAG